MRAIDKVLHSLRPLVEAENWDYLVLWELGDDPSRFIQWVGCCCSGAHGVCDNVKEGKTVISLCRDTFIQHFANFRACSKLAKFPLFIPLYSGMHGETVLSTEARWLSYTKDSSSDLCHELTGTRVLIPVTGGLVELFTTKNVPKDEKVIEFVTSRFRIKVKDELVPKQSYTDTNLYSIQPRISLINQNKTDIFHHFNSSHGPKILNISALPLSIYSSLEGSSAGSNPSYSVHVSPNASVNEVIDKQIYTTPKRDTNVILGSPLIETENVNLAMKINQEPYQSKNLITERKRRNRIRDGLLILRSLVPKISKMDKASILVDAIEFINEMREESKLLEDELNELTEDESNGKKINKLNSDKGGNPKKRKHDQSSAHVIEKTLVEIKVNEIGKKEFLVKLLSDHKQGKFMKLIDGFSSLGLHVIDVNTTSFDGQMMNIFRVEVNDVGVQPKILKELLIELTNNLH